MAGIKITAKDMDSGETLEQEIQPGQYSLVVADPAYLANTQRYANGTIVLTIKKGPGGDR